MTERETQRVLESIAISLNRIANVLESNQKETLDFRKALIEAISSASPKDNETKEK